MADQGVILSVRGEARRRVAPDAGVLYAGIRVVRETKEEALTDAAADQRALVADLASLGGVSLDVEHERAALTWSAFSATTHAEVEETRRTGRIIASVALRITVRELRLLPDVSTALAGHAAVDVQSVSWEVDDDNPAWRLVRRDAIQAAIRRAHDYADALGVTVVAVEQIADAGLLGTGASAGFARAPAGRLVNGGSVPALDPVPQELAAVIDARFRTSTATLTN